MTATTQPTNIVTLNDANSSVIPRAARGRFAPGGPGRAIGSRNKISSQLAAQIRALGPKAVEALASAIDEKQSWAVTLVIKLVVPGRLIEMHGSEPADIRDAFETGEISADELRTISAGLEK